MVVKAKEGSIVVEVCAINNVIDLIKANEILTMLARVIDSSCESVTNVT